MTDHSRAVDATELNRAITVLTEALARTERRSARLVRIIHWSMLGGLALLVIIGVLVAERLHTAYSSVDQFFSIVDEAIVSHEEISEHIEKKGYVCVKCW